MANPKLTIQRNCKQGTQDHEKQNKNTTQYVLCPTIRKQTQTRKKNQQIPISEKTQNITIKSDILTPMKYRNK